MLQKLKIINGEVISFLGAKFICLCLMFGLLLPSIALARQNFVSDINPFCIDKDNNVYLLKNGNLFHVQNAQGDVWDRKTEDCVSASIDPSNSNIFFVIKEDNTLQKTMDGGKNWITLNVRGASRLLSVIVDPNSSQEVYIGTMNGIFKSDDAGFSWSSTALSANISEFQISKDSSTIIALTSSNGLQCSLDKGKTWQSADAGLPKIPIKSKGRTLKYVPARVYYFTYQRKLKYMFL